MLLLVLIGAAAATTAAGGGLSRWLGGGGQPSDAKIGKGLKEALRVGAGNAVKITGTLDGYFKNEAIKILMPEKLRPVEKGLRTIGLGSKVDEFVLSMNRAAEKAAPFAKQIFVGAIKEMTFDDARKIFTGGDTAATDYFKSKTTVKLTAAFQPAVKQAMGEVGVTRQYEDLTGRWQSLPFGHREAFDLDAYVVGKALDGLFLVLGEEERKIRTDPAARVTSLLRDVFGRKAS
jgi:uncharacterized protein DUF4197